MNEALKAPSLQVPPELLELRAGYVNRLPKQIDEIAATMRVFSGNGWKRATGESLHRMVHSITGTAGTFGLHGISIAARQFEHHISSLLNAPMPPTEKQWSELEADMAQLKTVGLDIHPLEPLPAEPSPVEQPLSAPLVHLICDCKEQVEALGSALALKGYRVEVFTSPLNFQATASLHGFEQPAAVVLNMCSDGREILVSNLIQQLGLADHPPIPLIVGLSQPDLHNRVAATRAGANFTLSQPLSAEALNDALNSLTGGDKDHPWKVLLVDDEPDILKVHEVYLRQSGMDVRTLSDPMQTLVEVEAFEPDVLVIDVYMPEINGPEIAAALRESNIRPHLAIVFLSAETDMTQQLVALDLGGDDFLIKPVQPRHLVAAVTARARRARKNAIVQKRLETALYERQREQLAYDQHAIVSVFDRHGNFRYVNALFCQVTGYERDELIGRHHNQVRTDPLPNNVLREIEQEIAANRVWQGEICSHRKDGSSYWVETTITPFQDETGNLYQCVVIQTDISHIKETEARLRAQRDMQRMISVAAAELMAAPAHLTDETIQAALQASGELLGADNALLFKVNRDGAAMRNTHYWSANGKTTGREKVAHVPLAELTWMRNWFRQEGTAVVPDVNAMPPEANAERQALGATQTQAMIALPIMKKGQIGGFVGYSALQPMPHWTAEICELLSVLSEVIASALARQRAELALRESEARLSFLVSSSPVTIYSRSQSAPFELTWVSDNVQELMGLDQGSLLARRGAWIDRVHPDDREDLASAIYEVLDGDLHQKEYRVRFGDGPYRWIQDQIRLVRDDVNGKAELVGYWLDITERKRIEGELSRFNSELEQRVAEQTQNIIESERFARATLDALDARVAILDEHGVILAANRAWSEANKNPSCATPMHEGSNYIEHCDDLCGHPSTDGRPIATGLQAVILGTSDHHFHEYACPNAAEPRWFVCRIKRFQGDGALRVVVSHEDITAMKLIERQQMRSQRMESLGTLAGGVAHDLNNALAPILMGMGILKDQYPEEDKLISMINNSAKRGADMVRQLLTFAKGADGQRVVLQPAHLMLELESLMKASFPKNIAIQVNIEPGLPSVVGDATQLHQILLNLSVNARDAMPDGGLLAMEAKSVEIDAIYARSMIDSKPGKYVCLRVSDNGDGIPAHILDRIFDPFFTTKTQDKGTGLGLSTVLGIVKGHSGFVKVHSTPGKGTSFSVFLPVASSETVSEEVVREVAPKFKGQGEYILFVDDEQALREVGQTVLERLNFNPIVAKDGVDGLHKASLHRSSLKAIITDIHMPNMDGLAFVQAVRRTMPDIPILLASGRVDDNVAKEFRALGVTARLDKPFTEIQLAEKLSALLASKPALS